MRQWEQLYRCHACGRQSRENPTPMPIRSSPGGDSLCFIREQQFAWLDPHIWRLSPPSPIDQKKVALLPPFHHDLGASDPEESTSTMLELDELWSFVFKKKPSDLEYGLRSVGKTRQVVAYALGNSE